MTAEAANNESQPQRTIAKTLFGLVFLGLYGVGGLAFLCLGLADLAEVSTAPEVIVALVITLVIGLPIFAFGLIVGLLSLKGSNGGVLLGWIPALIVSLALILPTLIWLFSTKQAPYVKNSYWLTFYLANVLLTVVGFIALSGGDDSRDRT